MPRFGLIQTVSDYYLARALTNDGAKPLNVHEFMLMADRLDELRAGHEDGVTLGSDPILSAGGEEGPP